MKKTLLSSVIAATAIAPTLAFADSDVDVYGRINYVIMSQTDQSLSLNNAAVRLGVKGSGDTDLSGVQYFFQLEGQIYSDDGDEDDSILGSRDDADEEIRHANAGLMGDFGKVTIGRRTNPIASGVYDYTDLFEDGSGVFQQTPYRLGHSLIFNTADFSGASLYAGAVLEGGVDTDDEEYNNSGFLAGANYGIAGLSLGVGYYSVTLTDVDTANTIDTETEQTVIAAGGSYTMGAIYVGANYEMSTSDVDDLETDVTAMEVAATFGVSEALTLGVAYGAATTEVDDDTTDDVEETRILAGAYYNLGGRADTYLEYTTESTDVDDVDDVNTVYLGFRVKF